MGETGPRLRLRIEFDGEHTLGPGKVQLLEAVAEHGSISAAARSMQMSYRHAWEMLDDVNRCFSGRVLETEAGGRSGGGARVTDFGRTLISQYHQIQRDVRRAADQSLRELERSRGASEDPGGNQDGAGARARSHPKPRRRPPRPRSS